MRVSRVGLVIAAIYVVLSIGCIVWGYSLSSPKESTVLMQLPVVPALIALSVFRSMDWLAAVPLTVFYGVLVPAIAFGLYAACWLFGALDVRTRLIICICMLSVMSFMLLWPVRR